MILNRILYIVVNIFWNDKQEPENTVSLNLSLLKILEWFLNKFLYKISSNKLILGKIISNIVIDILHF